MTATQVINSYLYTNAYVTQEWTGGYKLEVDLTSEFDAKDWRLNFTLPDGYKVRDAYGVDLVNDGSGNYTISGQGGWQDLEPGSRPKSQS